MPDSIVLVGSPTALGGHFGGMERTPAEARRLGLVDRLRAAPGLAGASVVDAGDAPNEPGWAPDDDRRAKNRSRIAVYLPRLAGHVRDGLLAHDGAGLFVIGGDCTSHAGAMAGIRRARPGIRLGICWFDAHGDFNTPATTPSGNVWGMPFAMLLGHGDDDLVAACDGPTADARDAALLLDLAPGSYSAVVSGQGSVSGVALVEVYDATVGAIPREQRIINIATRATAGVGESSTLQQRRQTGKMPCSSSRRRMST